MPELPDVEYFKRYIDATALHQPIVHATVTNRAPLGQISAGTLRQHLQGRRFENTRRHGKHLGIQLDSPDWLVLHFGMTGQPVYQSTTSEMPDYTGLYIVFRNDHALAYVTRRRLGRIELTEDFDSFIEDRQLGPDALDDDLDADAFRSLLHGRHGTIKSLLMNQEILAGVGNVYADEVLFQAGIHPATSVDRLDGGKAAHLHRTLRRVLRIAADRHADPDKLPAGWLLPHRDDEQCPKGHGKLKKVKISGRTTYLCPKCQGRS